MKELGKELTTPNEIVSTHRDIHIGSEDEDENGIKEREEVSLRGEGGEEVADEGDAADVGDDH